MNNDIVPKKTPSQPPVPPRDDTYPKNNSPVTESKSEPSTRSYVETTVNRSTSDADVSPRKKWSKRKFVLSAIVALLGLLLAAGVGSYVWYTSSLEARSPGSTEKIRVSIPSGSSPDEIASELASKNIIKNKTAFSIYIRVQGVQNNLQAGSYSLSPSEDVAKIVTHLSSGKTDEFQVTFLPGATLKQNRSALIKSGYSEAEVDAAFKKTYDHPLFKDKPVGTDLEGYIYGETYNFLTDTSVEDILRRTFDEYYKTIQANQIEAGFAAQNLNLYQGITMASIVQREVPTAVDQKEVARVFYNRLADGMTLGSDVTFIYAADKLGVAPRVDLDSPYNTRIYKGLPPGPIATPGKSALIAAAYPAVNDYLFFLSGDDEKTYFARTDAEHQQNIVNHCQKKCSEL